MVTEGGCKRLARQSYTLPIETRTLSVLRDIARDHEASILVRGTCMEPSLRSGERVGIRATRVHLPGDVIVFRTHAGPLAAHRVLGWRPAGVVTKGDGCDRHDAPVTREMIVGTAMVRVTIADRVRALGELARIVARRLFG